MLDLDSIVASLLSKELKRKLVNRSTSSSRVYALVSEGSKGKASNANNGKTDNGNFKPRGALDVIIVIRLVTLKTIKENPR